MICMTTKEVNEIYEGSKSSATNQRKAILLLVPFPYKLQLNTNALVVDRIVKMVCL